MAWAAEEVEVAAEVVRRVPRCLRRQAPGGTASAGAEEAPPNHLRPPPRPNRAKEHEEAEFGPPVQAVRQEEQELVEQGEQQAAQSRVQLP